jgi:glycolate oxidase FAD binding subunit
MLSADELAAEVAAAFRESRPLVIGGGGSKLDYLPEPPPGLRVLEAVRHDGIVSHEPSELFVTARAGTPLDDIEQALAEAGQLLPFEPPHLGAGATLGGTVALGLSGPRRPWAGAVRDAILGVVLVNGEGERLAFGGSVMKNVAGFDVARLQAGARGTLGVLLEVTLKLMPRPHAQLTLSFDAGRDEALAHVVAWARQALPVSATCHVGEHLYVRLEGDGRGVEAAARQLGGRAVGDGTELWRTLRERQHEFFTRGGVLHRFVVPPASRYPDVAGDWLTEWGGAQRWLATRAELDVAGVAAAMGGQAMRWAPRDGFAIAPLPPELAALQQRVRAAFDPAGILNPHLAPHPAPAAGTALAR